MAFSLSEVYRCIIMYVRIHAPCWLKHTAFAALHCASTCRITMQFLHASGFMFIRQTVEESYTELQSLIQTHKVHHARIMTELATKTTKAKKQREQMSDKVWHYTYLEKLLDIFTSCKAMG